MPFEERSFALSIHWESFLDFNMIDNLDEIFFFQSSADGGIEKKRFMMSSSSPFELTSVGFELLQLRIHMSAN